MCAQRLATTMTTCCLWCKRHIQVWVPRNMLKVSAWFDIVILHSIMWLLLYNTCWCLSLENDALYLTMSRNNSTTMEFLVDVMMPSTSCVWCHHTFLVILFVFVAPGLRPRNDCYHVASRTVCQYAIASRRCGKVNPSSHRKSCSRTAIQCDTK